MSEVNQNSHLRVYHALKAMLVNYHFRPSEQLIIGELADKLRVSATPVRENLIRLHAEGLVDISPHRGFFVKSLTLDEMSDVLRLRYVLLKGAVEMRAQAGFANRLTYPLAPESCKHDEVNEGNKRNLSEADATARKVEGMLESIGVIGGEVMLASIRNANDRTHFIRTVQVESVAEADALIALTTSLHAAAEVGDRERALELLEADLGNSLGSMPQVIREGIARIYQSAWKVFPKPGALSRVL